MTDVIVALKRPEGYEDVDPVLVAEDAIKETWPDWEILAEVEDRADAAEAKLARAVKAIQDYLAGDYYNPRNHRPNTCKHGTNYWEECAQCDGDHFAQALAQIEQPQGEIDLHIQTPSTYSHIDWWKECIGGPYKPAVLTRGRFKHINPELVLEAIRETQGTKTADIVAALVWALSIENNRSQLLTQELFERIEQPQGEREGRG